MYNKKRVKLLFEDKKGLSHELFFNVFELVLASIVVLALLFFVNDVAKRTIFEKNYMALDLSLLISTISSAPGDVVYNYNENVEGFIFKFGNNKVEITDSENKEPIFYFFAKNKNIPLTDKTLSYEKEHVKMKFQKSAESISVDKPNVLNLDLASSQRIQTNDVT